MMNGGDVFDEHLGVIAALRDNYARHDDAKTIREMLAVQEEIQGLLRGREDGMKQVLSDLMSGVEDARIKATYPGDESAHRQRLASAEAELVSARKRIAQLTEELRSVESERQSLTGKLKELNSKQDEVDQLLQVLEPQIRHQLSLFAHISKISWQFDDESRVCGTVSDPDHADVRPFDLPIDTPTFEVTNKLWSLMSEAVN